MAASFQSAGVADLGRVVTGKTPQTAKPHLYGNGYPFITPTDISNLRFCEPTRQLSEEGRDSQRNLLLPTNAVCVTCIASVGKMCMTDRPSFTNQQINSVIVDENRHDPFFVYYLLQTQVGHLKAIAGGVATPIINKTAFSEIKLSVPPLPVQRRIALTLSAYDDLIENNTRRIQLLERMAQAIYREWFVNFRFPGHEKVKVVDSPMGAIPQGWSVQRLDQVANVNASSIRRGNEPDRVSYVDISSVVTGRIEKVESIAFAEAPGRARRMVRHGDTIWSCVRPNRKSYSLILDPPTDLIVSTGFAVLTPTRLPFTYVHQAVITDDFVAYLSNHATGAAYPAVTASDFEAAELLVPDQPLLRRFHEQCEPMLVSKENLMRRNATLRRTRDLLLPKLISGALAVPCLSVETSGIGNPS